MLMGLYFVQHGEAKSEAEDPERSLTIRGEEDTRKISGAAKRLGIRSSRIYHSGKKRVCGDERGKAVMFRYSAILCLEKKESGRWAVDRVIKPEIV
jgi:phosphohistidine phosphatase SixA